MDKRSILEFPHFHQQAFSQKYKQKSERHKMTDKELLELAAKAAGLEYTTTEDHDRLLVRGDDKLRRPWNPLTDDGDALRLAVKLGLQIVHYSVTSKGPDRVNAGRSGSPIPYGDDPLAATRRAITRAAAEIGKAMKS
jgi:hypothetical protein